MKSNKFDCNILTYQTIWYNNLFCTSKNN